MDYLIFLFAFIFRLFSLNQSLWLDEATTAQVVHKLSFGKILTMFAPTDFHPPLFYIFIKLWTNVFGYTEVALRMPSVIFSLLTGLIIYKLLGRWAAVLFLFNPLIIYYSQEARMYSLATFLIFLSYYFVHQLLMNSKEEKRNIHKGSKKYSISKIFHHLISYTPTLTHFIIYANIAICLSFLSFYGSVFFIVSLYLYLIYKKRYRLLMQVLPGFVLALIIISPLLVKQLAHAKEQLVLMPRWGAVLGGAEIKNVFLIPLKFLLGRISWEPKWKYYVSALSWVLLVTVLVLRSIYKRYKVMKYEKKLVRYQYNFLLIEFSFFLFMPLVLGYVFSFYKPVMQYFRFLYVVPFMTLLIAYALRRSWQKTLILAGFVFFSLLYLFYPPFQREDWKGMLQSLPAKTTLYMIPSSSDPVGYYRPDVVVRDIRALSSQKDRPKRLQIIPYTVEIYGVEYKKNLMEAKYSLRSVNSSRGVTIEVWNK